MDGRGQADRRGDRALSTIPTSAAPTPDELSQPAKPRVLAWPVRYGPQPAPAPSREAGAFRAIQSRGLAVLHGWHLLSLDAPTIAALWTYFIAVAAGLHLPAVEIAAMGVAVWLLYAADRLLDARSSHALEARHHFHQQHRRRFLTGIVIAACILAVLLPEVNPLAIHRYLVLGALLAGWFVLIHAAPGERRLPKELAVGLFFPAAVFIPTIARDLHLRLVLLPHALLFAAICSLNCLAIYAWEHPTVAADDVHWTTRRAVPHLQTLLLVTMAAATLLLAITPAPLRMLPIACAIAAAVLLSLHRHAGRMRRLTLRAAADAALLGPLLLLAIAHLLSRA